MTVDATLEAVVRRDRVVVIAALVIVIGLSWVYLLGGAGMGMSALEMTRMSQAGMAEGAGQGSMAGMAMMTPAVWTPTYAVLMFFMWWIMMVAMMLPSTAPKTMFVPTSIGDRMPVRSNPHCSTTAIRLNPAQAARYPTANRLVDT